MTARAAQVSRRGLADDLAVHGGRPALIAGDDLLTYAELDGRVREVAERLGDVRRLVAIEATRTVDSVVTYLAAMRGRHPVLVLSSDEDATARLVHTYQPDVVVGAATGWSVQERRPGTAHDLHPDLALLMSTSGSTGSAKLVRLSSESVVANAASIAAYLGLTEGDRAITTLPLHYCYGLSVLNSHLASGASVVLDERSVVDACFWERFRHTACTSFAGVPYTFEMLDAVGFEDMSLPSLRYVTQAGGRMDPERVRRYAAMAQRDGWDLYVMYGQTEATARMAYLPPHLARDRPDAIGGPIPGGELSIEPLDGEDRADGVGELVYRGPNVMLGYAASSEDLARGRDVEVLHTGDLGRRAPDGLFEITGRCRRVVKPFGIRVELDHLEQLLARDGIAAVCTGGDDAIAVAVTDADVDEVRRVAARHTGIPRRHVAAVALAEVPRLPSGKPDYAAIRAAAEAPGAPARPNKSGAGGHISDPVLAVYQEVLGRALDSEDTFVSAGGDSLSYVELSMRLEHLLGSVPAGWHLRPIRELAPAPVPRRRAVRWVDVTVPLRAIAIVLVVGSHAKVWHLLGGAHLLMGVAGYNFGRFQRSAAGALRGARRIAVPAVAWIAVVAALSGRYNVANALLATSLLSRPADLWAYWFVEALVQILVVVGVVLAVPAVRRLERRAPFALAMAACGLCLSIRFDVVRIGPENHPIERAHQVAWLFALGWAAAAAGGCVVRRASVSLVAAVAVPGFFGSPSREGLILVGMLLVIWVPRVPLPDPFPRLVALVASASLWIYLSHWQLYPAVSRVSGPTAALLASVAVGALLWTIERRTSRALAARWRSLGAACTEPPDDHSSTNDRSVSVDRAWQSPRPRRRSGGIS